MDLHPPWSSDIVQMYSDLCGLTFYQYKIWHCSSVVVLVFFGVLEHLFLVVLLTSPGDENSQVRASALVVTSRCSFRWQEIKRRTKAGAGERWRGKEEKIKAGDKTWRSMENTASKDYMKGGVTRKYIFSSFRVKGPPPCSQSWFVHSPQPPVPE